MRPGATYDAVDAILCGMILFFVGGALYWTKRTPDEFDDEPMPTRLEKFTVWWIAVMVAALLWMLMMRR